MHPLVARIHPSFRTAFFAWVVARAAVWLGLHARTGAVLPDRGEVVGSHAYRLLVDGTRLAGEWAPHLLAGLGELILFFGVVAVYRFARRDGMPQTADRAAWLWIASPAMVFATPGADFTFAYGLVALAMASVARPGWSALALAVAIAFRPESILVWPALGFGWWAQNKDDPAVKLAFTMIPPAVFGATIFAGLLLGEPQAFIGAEAGWRTDWAWHGFLHHADELMVAALLVGAIAVALRMVKETPTSWLFVTLPLVALVAVHDPIFAGVAFVPLAIPLFVQLAKFAQDMGLERILLSASLVALCLLSV